MDGTFTAMPRQARVFESSLHSTTRNTRHTAFDNLIRDTLIQIAQDYNSMGADSPSSPPAGPLLSQESATILRELGDYFTHQIAFDIHNRSAEVTNLTDMSTISAVDVEIGRLRQIRDLTAQFSQDVQAIWRPDSGILDNSSSSQCSRGGQLPIANMLSAASSQEAQFMGHGHPANENLNTLTGGMAEQMDLGNDSDSDSDSGDEELFAAIDMESLKQRGKGSYTCPKGTKCDKGGVDKDGNVIIFDRNSSFAQHCNKHRKPWVCDLANCPNTPKKRRFARRDGLERHKQTVKHEPKTAESQIGVS
ncbi:hypothetical protein MY3296_005103 [Beauveria thailandica]